MWIDLLVLSLGLLGFSILIAVHEWGHFSVAKWCRMIVFDFSVGLGRRLLRFRYRNTDYNLRLVPIGGFVEIHGEEGGGGSRYRRKLKTWLRGRPIAEARALLDRTRRARNRPWYQQLAMAAAGPAASLALGFLLFFGVGLVAGVATETRTDGVRIAEAVPGMAAERAGVRANDVILAINGRSIETSTELLTEIALNGAEEQQLSIQRGTERLITSVRAEEVRESSDVLGRFLLGVRMAPREVSFARGRPLLALTDAWERTSWMVSLQCRGVWRLVTGRVPLESVNGPMGTLYVVSNSLNYGIVSFVSVLATISIALAVMNMVPLLPLDGGRILFSLLQGALGRPIPFRIKLGASAVGACLLFGTMLVTVYSDSVRLLTAGS